MKISELMEMLGERQSELGDVEVVVRDKSGYWFEIADVLPTTFNSWNDAMLALDIEKAVDSLDLDPAISKH